MANGNAYVKSRRNVRVVMLPQERAIANLGAASRWSFTVLQWLLIHSRDAPFDTIVFPEYKARAPIQVAPALPPPCSARGRMAHHCTKRSRLRWAGTVRYM